jgi:hypothetical protein
MKQREGQKSSMTEALEFEQNTVSVYASYNHIIHIENREHISLW